MKYRDYIDGLRAGQLLRYSHFMWEYPMCTVAMLVWT